MGIYMNFNIGKMEVEDVISMYVAIVRNSGISNKNIAISFLRNVSFIVSLIKHGFDAQSLKNIAKLLDKKTNSYIKKLVEIIKKDIRCVLVHDSPVLEELENIGKIGIQKGGDDALGEDVNVDEFGEFMEEEEENDIDDADADADAGDKEEDDGENGAE